LKERRKKGKSWDPRSVTGKSGFLSLASSLSDRAGERSVRVGSGIFSGRGFELRDRDFLGS
jgi:hypothetical protein